MKKFLTIRSAAFNACLHLGVLACLAPLASSPSAFAQLAGKGQIKGTVMDQTGAAIPNATVVIKSKLTGVSTTVTSTSAGEYSAPILDPGTYTVTVTAAGFQTLAQDNVNVNALETQSFDPKMTVGSTDQTVEVTSAPPQLETTNATLGGTMEQDLYSALPIEMGAYGQADQRRATDFAFLMPGVQGNNTTGNPTTNTGIVNGSGSKGAVSAVYIDGLPFVRAGGNGDPRFVWTAISVDAVNQFQVQTNGYSAIYEGQGIQNYTIKQGGNKFHGQIYEFFRNTALDTYGFFGKLPNPATGLVHKPIEHSNEYGINLSGPLVPFGSWKEKLFFFGNYNGFRYASETPTAVSFPTAAEQSGNFQGIAAIYDPSTEATCASHNTNGAPCRYRYGYIYGGTPGANGGAVLGPQGAAGVDVIPASQLSAVALKLQSYLPSGIGTSAQNNYISPNRTGLNNFSHTERIDYVINSKNTLTLIGSFGRQASSVPVAQNTAGRNVGPIPYNYGQAYAPKTAVGVIEDTYVISPRLVNQVKYGYARYDGPTFNANQAPAYAAAAQGIGGLPGGQASASFPIVTFAGTNAPTNWGGTTANRVLAENYTLVDNVQYTLGRHSVTVGGQIAWLTYQNTPATTGITPLTLATAVTETAALNNSFAATGNTGNSYASFLLGQIDSQKLTNYAVQEYGARERAISGYVQDNWKVGNRLTLDLGVRYDFFPPFHDVLDNVSFFNPGLANPVTGVNGAIQYAGNGANTCNCDTPVQNYYKNIGPRLGAAYQLDSKTVLRASYGIMFTHGNGVGGGGSSYSGQNSNSNGFSASLNTQPTSTLVSSNPLTAANSPIATVPTALGRASGAQFTTGYTVNTLNGASYTGAPASVAYFDPYLGSRAPEFVNYSFGMQHQFGEMFVLTASYVGSQGHFLGADGSNARGYYADQLDPKYLYLNSTLTTQGTALTTFCQNNTSVCPSYYNAFYTGASGGLATLLKPFPFHSVSDFFANVSNSVYNALQVTANMRASHGLTFMANYTWSRSIDDGGTFRSGYAIPAGTINNSSRGYAQDAIERTVSTTSQPHHVVVTGVYDLPFGRTILNSNAVERAVVGGFKFSTIFQAFSGSPLPITGASCNPNPAQATCMPSYNVNFTNPNNARVNGKHWGQGVTAANYSTGGSGTGAPASNQFINPLAFQYAPAYTFGNLPRTAPYNLTGPGNYNLDLALVRSFPLHLTESSRLNFRAEWYNVTNHTQFAVASSVYGNANFGQVAPNPTASRKSAQFSARLEF